MSARRGGLVPLDDVTTSLIYTRVSSDEQEKEGVSLDDQLTTGRAYCAARRMVIGGEYQDIQTGTKATRADYQRMLAEARALKAEGRRPAIVVKFQDRLGRNILESARAYVELTGLGIDVHVAESGGVPSELEYYMRALIAQEESRNISRRTKSVYRHFAEKGWHRPGQLPWGYALRPRTEAEHDAGAPRNVLTIDKKTAPYVQEAWQRRADGASIRDVAKWIARLPSEARGGRVMGYNTVRKFLSAPVYVARGGQPDHDDPDAVLARPIARWPRLVEDDTWRRVTARRELAEKMPPQASGDFPLSGLLYCPRPGCGARMQGRTRQPYGALKTARREYICSGAMVVGADHIATLCYLTVPADAIEQPVLSTLVSTLTAAGEPRTRQAVIREIRRQAAEPDAEDTARLIADLEVSRRQTEDRLHGLTATLLDKVIDADQYKRSSAVFRADLDAINARLGELRGRAPKVAPITPLDAILGTCSALARALSETEVGPLRETLGHLLDRVEPVRIGRGVYEPDYTWTPAGWLMVQAALVALARQEGDDAADRRARLVRVERQGSSKMSTSTMSALLRAWSA
jgi:DNA invertase Pin-like site-specific DNA recombinase